MKLEVLFAPAEFDQLARRPLHQTTCVVFDVLRATSSMISALANGAAGIWPVESIPEALALRQLHPDVLLAGEREGLRIRAEQAGGVDFDLGNSPREFTSERVRDRSIAMTTTNGTLALRACRGARLVVIGTFLNLHAIVHHLQQTRPAELLVVCSGTFDQAAYEDVLGAGALCTRVWDIYAGGQVADSAKMARDLYLLAQGDLPKAIAKSRNGARLLSRPDLADDVNFCIQVGVFDFLAHQDEHGWVTRSLMAN